MFELLKRWGRRTAVLCALAGASATAAGTASLQIRNGHFWDPAAGDYILPRGIAYQVWNPPVGANQSLAQVDYDLIEFKKMYLNSVRCEFVWSQVQTGSNTWNWAKPDHLVEQAERLGLKLFVIIGFQYPPSWFPTEWRGINEQSLTPEVLACLGSGGGTNCLPKPVYDQLFTNQLPAEVISSTLHCLTSSPPSEVIRCLINNLPLAYSSGPSNVLSYFVSDVINYEHPDARRVYTNHIAKVVERYKNSPAIGAWILGNECAYFDLWEDAKVYAVHRYLGYDSYSQAAFRAYLKAFYNQDISGLNARWGTHYPDFESVEMPRVFPADRNAPAFTDLTHWRQQSIGRFIGSGAATAKAFDPNHLLTYSMVGGIFNGNDIDNTCEDAQSIVAECRAAAGALDFWSVNNYAWSAHGNELRTADFGISKYQDLLGLPVMVSETGHSSTEDLFVGAAARQANALPGQIWESVLSGAIGTHLFHWNDRNQFTQGYFDREKGFGIVHEDRTVKDPVYWNMLNVFRRMREIRIDNLMGNSSNPPPEIQLFWSKAGDLTWPSANQENTMIWGALRRLGFQVAAIDDTRFRQKAYTNAQALLLSRCWQLDPVDLDALANSGINLHANADLPGQVDAYVRPNPKWAEQMRLLFGLDASNALNAFDSDAVDESNTGLQLFGGTNLGPITPSYVAQFSTWKIWHGLRPVSGTTLLRDSGLNGTQKNPMVPAVQLNTLGRARTAINTFALGNTDVGDGDPSRLYGIRYDILHAIYRDHFHMTPVVDISGPGAKQVLSDYRLCRNGTVLVSLLNEETTPAVITVSAPSLWTGRTIEDITAGGVIARNSNGTLDFSLSADQYLLLYAYDRVGGQDTSLINPSPNKLWFKSAPLAVWPNGAPINVQVGYSLPGPALSLRVSLEQLQPARRVVVQSGPMTVQSEGMNELSLTVPDADLHDPDYVSSANGGEYVFHATLEQNGVVQSETSLPVRLLWAVTPTGPLPANPSPGSIVQVALEWQELPSYQPDDPMPLDRAWLWESAAADAQHEDFTLQLLDASGQVAASNTLVTNRGSGTNLFTLLVPATAKGPFTWAAIAQSAPGTISESVDDSFEGRDRGEDRAPFYPWFGYSYPAIQSVDLAEQGVTNDPDSGVSNLVAYLTVNNAGVASGLSGFGLKQGRDGWALPVNRQLWKPFTFSFKFKEAHRLPCILEMQIEDANTNRVELTKSYTPGTDGWDTIQAALSAFTPSLSTGSFDPARAQGWALNVRMLQTNATYTGYFDQVQFVGPTTLNDDFEDRRPGYYFIRIAPWTGYGYDAAGHPDVLLDEGVSLDEASDGSQAAFMVAWNRTDSGPFAGFGILYPYSKIWAMPADTRRWPEYSFSCDFKERFGLPCILELQVKGPDTVEANGAVRQHALHFLKPYMPGPDNWDRITASLDQFTEPGYFPFAPFDPKQISSLVINVQMLQTNPQTNVVYVGWIDNIQFHAPETPGPGITTYGVYSSANDSFRIASVVLNVTDRSVLVSWIGNGILQQANDVAGPWKDVDAAKSPAKIELTGFSRFFRLRP